MPLVRVIIRGSISAGKTRLLSELKKSLGSKVKIFPEPSNDWTSFHAEYSHRNYNLLHEIYNGKQAFENQVFIFFNLFLKFMAVFKEAVLQRKQWLITERSPYDGLFVFGRALHLTTKQLDFLYYGCHEAMKLLEAENPHNLLVIYLKCPPDVCMKRVKNRNRKEETFSIKYLNELEKLYNDWYKHKFFPEKPHKIYMVDSNRSLDQVTNDVLKILKENTYLQFK